MTAPPTPEPFEYESPLHWWCRRCGRWTVVDDRDVCPECAFHMQRLTGFAALQAITDALARRLRGR